MGFLVIAGRQMAECALDRLLLFPPRLFAVSTFAWRGVLHHVITFNNNRPTGYIVWLSLFFFFFPLLVYFYYIRSILLGNDHSLAGLMSNLFFLFFFFWLVKMCVQ